MTAPDDDSAKDGFELPRDEWVKRLEELASGLEAQIMDDVHYRKPDGDDLVRSAAIVVGAMARAIREGDAGAVRELTAPAKRYLRDKVDARRHVPGTAVVPERRDVVERVKTAVVARLGAIRPGYHPRSQETNAALEVTARIILDTILDDPEVAKPLLAKSPKAQSSAKGTVLPPERPGPERQGEIIEHVVKVFRRELAEGTTNDAIAETAIIGALTDLGMNAKDIFK